MLVQKKEEQQQFLKADWWLKDRLNPPVDMEWFGPRRLPFHRLNVSSDMQGGKEYLASKSRICSTKNKYKIQWSSLQKLRPHT